MKCVKEKIDFVGKNRGWNDIAGKAGVNRVMYPAYNALMGHPSVSNNIRDNVLSETRKEIRK